MFSEKVKALSGAASMDGMALMYHEISPRHQVQFSGRQHFSWFYSIDPVDFKQHLQWLKAFRVNVIRVERVNGRQGQCGRFALLTFDDGGISGYEVTQNLLEKYGYPGHFFIVTDYVDAKGYMTRGMLAELANKGHCIGSHSKSHGNLTKMDGPALKQEVEDSKKFLEDMLQSPCESFSVPSGYVSMTVLEALQKAGYKYVFTSEPGSITRMDGDFHCFCRWHVEYKPPMLLKLLQRDPFFMLHRRLRWKLLRAVRTLKGDVFLEAYHRVSYAFLRKSQ